MTDLLTPNQIWNVPKGIKIIPYLIWRNFNVKGLYSL